MHIGEIRLFAGDYEPEGWAYCDGRLLDPKKHPELFQKTGTTFGGDGNATFAIPDLRGSAPVHRARGVQPGSEDSIQFDRDGSPRRPARLGLHHLIALTDQSHFRETPMTGEVRLWTLDKTPRDWMVCAGQLLPIGRNTMMFALLHNTFGGDGRSTFALPDLRGAFAFHPATPDERGQKSGASADEDGAGPLLALRYCIAMKGIFPSRPS